MFRYFVLGFICALVGIYHLPEPPWTSFTLSLCLLSVCLLGLWFVISSHVKQTDRGILTQLISIIIQLILGGLIAFLLSFCVEKLSVKIPESALNQKVWVEGDVVGLTTEKPTAFGQTKVQFTLKLSKVDNLHPPTWQIFAPKIKLAWYVEKTASSHENFHSHPQLNFPRAGETWRFHIKLKPTHFSLNPGAFDYETYLFQQSIQAVGYVLTDKHQASAEKLSPASGFYLQQWVWQRLHPWFQQSPFGGIYSALLYGDKSEITATQWQVFRQTGTIHLMAISGLHIGIVAAMGFGLFALLWRGFVLYLPHNNRLRLRVARTPKVIWGSLGAALLALAYMALSGFAIPTIRAGLMVLILLGFILSRRRFQVWTALALAAFIITLPDSKAVLSQGFWLSFTAVAIIYLVIASPGFSKRKTWQQFLWLQFALTLGMAPILALFYGQVPTVGFVANLIAVPFVTVLALPLLMLTAVFLLLLSPAWPSAAEWLLHLNNALWQPLWFVLSDIIHLGQHAAVYWLPGQVSSIALVVLYAGLALWLGAKWPASLRFNGRTFAWRDSFRWTGAVVMIVAFFGLSDGYSAFKNNVPPGEVKVTMLDVGQGQAMVFETTHHTLVYDTGPKYSDALDGASMALLPYLAHEKRNSVEVLMVSHSDMDHAGGTQTLLNNIQVNRAVSGQPKLLNARLKKAELQAVFRPCYAGQSWIFDQVRFEVLSPEKGRVATDDNDASCVLRVSTGKIAMMVMGDASKTIEQALIARYQHSEKSALTSQVLVAGHHGSQTATSQAWLESVKPKLVLFSAGYLNRYHFPNSSVLDRLVKLGIAKLNTACSGAVTLKMTPNAFQVENRQRLDHKTWYHHQCKAP